MYYRLLCLVLVLVVFTQSAPTARSEEFENRVLLLVEDLGAPTGKQRRAAEDALVRLAESSPAQADRLLQLLPLPDVSMPQFVRQALQKVRRRTERTLAQQATAASRVTLQVTEAPLSEVLKEIGQQTGVVLRDSRGDFAQEQNPTTVTLTCDNQPFWFAVDKLLDAANLSVYPYGEDGELVLTPREPAEGPRSGVAAYSGPFRFETTSVSVIRGLRNAEASRLDLVVEASWEPRLRPIAISLPMEELIMTGADGQRLLERTPGQLIEIESVPGEQATDLTLSFALPDRKLDRIEGVAGRLTAMIPATPQEFRVDQIGTVKLPRVQRFDGGSVTLAKFQKVNSIWELHMRLKLADASEALASHRGWVFRNKSYLVDAQGKRIEHAGFETTLQTDSEIGIAYLFDLSGGEIYDFGFDEEAPNGDAEEATEIDPATLTWVYETATRVYTAPIEWELGPINLP